MNFFSKWIRSVGRRFRGLENQEDTASDAETENDTETGARDEPQSSLFYCPECKTVYIATDKVACSTCDTTVDQVSSTVAETA